MRGADEFGAALYGRSREVRRDMQPTLGSLFAGIGGIDLGFERAGFRTVWQVEIDPYCRKVLARHFPDAERFEDVRTVGAGSLRRVDVIAGGFPCQDISSAGGSGEGIEGKRSILWFEMARIIGELRPYYVLVENSPNLLRRGMGGVLGALAKIGYDAEWRVISACSVGASHTRKRLFVVCYPMCGRFEGDNRGWHVSIPSTGLRWPTESEVRRAPNGIRNRVDRIRGLGNAVVPQIPELIARRIYDILARPTP